MRTDSPRDPGPRENPHGPLVFWYRAAKPTRARAIAGLVLLLCLGVLATAGSLAPDPAGVGTHRRLFGGLPPCTAIVVLGYPCPGCGMTTAFAHTVRGQWPAAFMAQPAGFLLALFTVAAGAASAGVLVTGRVLAPNWARLTPFWLACIVVSVLLAGWAFKLIVGLATGALPYR